MDNRHRWNRFFSCLAGTGLVLLPLLLAVLPAGASNQAMPATESASWAFDNNVTVRSWTNNTSCTSYSMASNNTSPGDCTGYGGSWSWSCNGASTYLYEPGNYSMTVDDRGPLGLARNITMNATWILDDAGRQALAGQSAFNLGYCLAGGNASASDITSMQTELANVGLAVLQGKSRHYSPAPMGQAWGLDAATNLTGTGQREFQAKAGSHSVSLTANSASSFYSGVTNSTNWVGGDSALELNTTNAAGVVSVWNMDEGHDLTTADSSGNTSGNASGNGGNITGYCVLGCLNASQIWNASGAKFGAYALSDTNANQTGGDYAVQNQSNTNNAYNNGGQKFTAEGWFYEVSSAGNQWFMDYDWQGDWALLTDGSGHFRVDLNGHLGDLKCISSATIPLNRWNFVAVTANSSETDVYADLNGNGTSIPVVTCPYNHGPSAKNPKFEVGSCSPATSSCTLNNYPWQGTFDEIRYTSGIQQYTSSFSTPTASFSNYKSSGTWTSQVFDEGPTAYYINFTNVSTTTGPDGISWESRYSNTSFTQNDITPAWTSLGNGTQTVAGRSTDSIGKYARYAQFRATLWSATGATTPKMTTFYLNFTAGPPSQSGPLTGNVTYAAPGEPVLVGVPYADAEDHVASVADLRNSTTHLCTNTTNATGNSTAYCGFTWGATADGVAETLTPALADIDGAVNTTNGSAPITTDNAAPVISLDAISNTSTGTFTLNLAGKDNASGTNRTWFDLTNISNGSYVGTYTNYTWTTNGTLTLCATCTGQFTLSAQSDDNIPQSWRHTAARSNSTFYIDPGPSFSTFTITTSGSDITSLVNISIIISDNVGPVTQAVADITGPGPKSAVYALALTSGNATSGTWTFSGSIGNNFSALGSYQVQIAAMDASTTTLTYSTNQTISFAGAGTSGASSATIAEQSLGGGGGGGGGGPTTVLATPSPSAAPLTNAPSGLLCPSEVSQVYYRGARDTGNYTWSYTCRTAAGVVVSSCSIHGEGVNGSGLSGVIDPWWSCSTSGDAVTATYSVPPSAVPQSGVGPLLSWSTGAHLVAVEGANQTAIDFRLTILNGGGGLSLGLADSVIAQFTPLSVPSLVAAGVFVLTAFFLAKTWLRYLWVLAAAGVAWYGFSAPAGGLLWGWVGYGAVGGMAWIGVTLHFKQKLSALQARYS